MGRAIEQLLKIKIYSYRRFGKNPWLKKKKSIVILLPKLECQKLYSVWKRNKFWWKLEEDRLLKCTLWIVYEAHRFSSSVPSHTIYHSMTCNQCYIFVYKSKMILFLEFPVLYNLLRTTFYVPKRTNKHSSMHKYRSFLN